MKFGVVVFPGSNCDEDVVYVLKNILNQDVVKLWHKDQSLHNCDFIILPGGFSYGDYLRSGAIARFSPIMDSVVNHAEKGGYLMGICNGFQVLAEAGLVPGALLRNIEQKFICKNTFIKPYASNSIVTSGLDYNRAYKIPVAHAEGRYFADQNTLAELHKNNQVLFKYCDEQGNVCQEANCNGSENNIAGVSNKRGNVFGLMPHPERAADSLLGNLDGKEIFESILQMVEA
ncbi:MAG TPA: phosphoribosylformylglycinamidine synthase subunit PurQ [Cytophagales bacterium]|nr:phosphoribosylformylglycinamidine synthase subunit PurQ [Cytophagales bacterium]